MAASASGMIGVAMRDDARRGCLDRGNRGGFRRQIGGTQPGGAGKAADVKAAQRSDPPQREVAEVGVHRRVGMHRQIARLQRRIGEPFGQPGDADARRSLRVGADRQPGHQHRTARFGAQMPRVLGQIGEQQQQRQIGRAGRRDQGGERLPSAALASVPTRRAQQSARFPAGGSLMGVEGGERMG